MNHSEKARDLFLSGYNCAQSVFAAFCDVTGLDTGTALKLSSSFGGGMGGLRSTCGAVTGMFLVAGCLCGYADAADYEKKKTHYAGIRSLAAAFEAKYQTIVCRELLQNMPGILQSDPLPRTEAYYKARPCVRFVMEAASILDAFLAEQGMLPEADGSTA